VGQASTACRLVAGGCGGGEVGQGAAARCRALLVGRGGGGGQ
jgi:hypothetical protein